MRQKAKVEKYDAPAGGWGSVNAVVHILTQEEVAVLGSEILLKQNKPGGFMCVSCSWAKPSKPHPFEFCENGAKATAWEITGKTVTPEFFSQHTLTELRTWSDHELEEQGRLAAPMRYDPATDKYVPLEWDDAFREIGAELNNLDPHSVVMYTSGRASLEASYMYQLFGRMYGTKSFSGQFEHVPREHIRGVAAGDRRSRRHGPLEGFRADRLHFVFWSQHDHQCAAHVAPPARSGAARRADHYVA